MGNVSTWVHPIYVSFGVDVCSIISTTVGFCSFLGFSSVSFFL